MFCILFTMCTYPSQSVKISIHSCTFSKNLPIRRLMPFFIILLICPVFILLSILMKYAISAIYLQKYKKIFRNVIIGMDM